MKFNVKEWKEFRVGDLFDIVGSTSTPLEQLEDIGEGNYPYVTTSTFNNGVAGFYKKKTEKGNIICIESACAAFATYQSDDFSASDHVEKCIPKFKLNANIAMFLVSILNLDQYKYSYGRKCNQIRIRDRIIKLPADPKGEPDWFFMENYIKSLHYKPLTTENKPGQAPDLNVKDWKEFEIEALFPVIIKGKCNDASCLSAGNDINYIGAKYSDNGVMKSCSLHENINYISEGNCVAMIGQGQGSAGYAIYLDSDFIGSTALNLGYADWVNPYTAHFVTTVLCKEYEKYSFGRSWTGYRVKKTKIKLPADTNGKPDWLFMENYIKSLPYGDRLDG